MSEEAAYRCQGLSFSKISHSAASPVTSEPVATMDAAGSRRISRPANSEITSMNSVLGSR